MCVEYDKLVGQPPDRSGAKAGFHSLQELLNYFGMRLKGTF